MRDIELRQYEPPLPNDMIKLLDNKDITKVQEILYLFIIFYFIFFFFQCLRVFFFGFI